MTDPRAHRRALQTLLDAERPVRRRPDDRPLPWSDPDFSRRLLTLHLDPDTHQASRRPEVIAAHVDWLETLLPAGGRLLEVACGPGLYCHELARRGHGAVGFDVAPAALAHARRVAAAEDLDCRFLELDLTRLPDDLPARVGPVDAVAFWFGDFHGFTPAQAADFVPRLAACLRPGGRFVLEYQPLDDFLTEAGSEWSAVAAGPFGDRPHLWLQEYGWDPETREELHVHWILEPESGRLERFVQCHQGWTDAQLTALLAEAALVDPVFHAPLTGADAAFEFPVLVTRRSPRSA